MLMHDVYSTPVWLLTCVLFVSFFQNEAADLRVRSVSIARATGQGKAQTNSRLDLRHT